ncbi:ABC transporter permease [Oscillochloris sp. ZM17-4]|uniref:ABC transporter permease n=1 Tax=Oscillochloris sp. ZM17-4 TaxID=2866714 RepID=UPI001C738FF2|nr:ABC transporter permease [Oscillochloris sp. ZM17-4]MBX0328734.1 ABC transporter permease [Oscillochloris sp. ZM17-4]
MTFRDMLATALENLGRRKVRTVLTSTGVIVGILTIVTMVSLGVGVQSEIQAQFSALGLENLFVRPGEQRSQDFFTRYAEPQREHPITPEVIAEWGRLPGVVSVTPVIDLSAVASSLELPGGDLSAVSVVGPRVFAPNPFQRELTAVAGTITLAAERRGEMVLGQGALPSGVRPEDVVGKQLNIVLRSPRGETERFPLTVVGVSSGEDSEAQATALDMAAMKSWWFNTPDYLDAQGYDSAVVRAKDVSIATQLLATFRDAGFRVQSLELILDAANRVFALINVMLSSIGGLALFVASLGIVNTMIMAIYERTREIGTLKAIGASRGDIRNMFMIEAGLIGALGGVVGIIGGWLLGILLNQVIAWYIAQESLPIQATFFVTPWWLALAALGFAGLVGVVAGLYPAARAARLDPLVALRYE